MCAVETLTSSRRHIASAAAIIALFSLAACATHEEKVAQKEDRLAAAGFIVRPANTTERQDMLNSLPPHHFVQRVHGDTVSFVYADPLVCDCLYVGSQQAYNQYKLGVQQQHLADQQEMTAQLYSNPRWNWSGWGAWGPGYGPGPGW